MLAVYKRELRMYMTSMTGFIFMAINILLVGIYFTSYNLLYGYPYFSYTLSAVCFVFLITTPILTMRIIADERKQKTDQILLTSPVSIFKIVMGKYLSLVTVYAVPLFLFCTYPLLLSKFGEVSLTRSYIAIFAFLLMGAAYLAVGMFLSSVTESPVIAAVATFVVLFAMYMEQGISSFFTETAFTSYLAFMVLLILLCLFLYSMIKNMRAAVLAGVAGGVVLTAIYLFYPSALTGTFQKLLGAFELSGGFQNFVNGIFDIRVIVYYLSVVIVCMCLTLQAIQKRRWS